MLSAALAFTPVIDVMAEENAAQTEEGSSTGKTEESGAVDQTEVGEDETRGQTVAGSVGDYIPSELDYNTPIYEPGFEAYGERELESKYPENGIEDIKAKYPVVRNQNPYGTCWTFASMGLAEFDLINDGSVDQKVDLSELQLAYFTYNSVIDPLGGTRGDYSKYYVENSVIEGGYLNRGGNYSMASRRLNQWVGPVNESDVPYAQAANVLQMGLPDEFAYSHNVAHLENTYMINIKSNPEEVKKQIKEHGAAGIMYYHSDLGYHFINNNYCDTDKSGGGHAVMVVGWDDNYSKDLFREGVKPSKNGAWLVRNSWGESKGNVNNCEYFWMSYETNSLADTAWIFDFTRDDGYDNNYQVDGGLDLGTYKYSKPTPVANIFTTQKKEGVSSEDLKAVSVSFTSKTNAEYKIEIYTDLKKEGDPYSGTKQESATTEGVTNYAGVYTIELANPVNLKPGTTYAVVVTTDAIDWERVAMVEENNGKKVWDVAVSSTDPKSYYCYQKYYWKEDQYGYNYCIKAFTTNNRDFGEKIKGTSVTLNGSIDMNLYVDIPKNSELMNDQDAYIEFKVNGNTSKVKVSDAKETGNGKKFTCPVVAKEMTSEIQAQFVSEGERSQVYTYTVRDYAEEILKDSKGLYSEKAKNLVKAMLNYGANAQTYFGYNTENLANANLSGTDKDASLKDCDFTGYKPTWTQNETVTGIKYYGSSLNLNTNTNVNNYFELEEGHTIDEYTFSYTTNGKTCEVTPVQKTMGDKELYLVEIPDIKSYLLNEKIEVTIKSKAQPESTGIKMSYSPFSYCYAASVLCSDKPSLINLTKSLYWYWYNADQYMKSTNS